MCPDSRILSNFPLFVKGFFAHPAGKALTAAAGGGEAKAKPAAAREAPPPALPKGGGAPSRRRQASPEPQRQRGLDNGETLCYTINAPTGGGSESAFSVGPSPQGLGPLSLSRNGSAARNRTERRPRSPPLQGSPRAAAASQPGNFQPRKRPPPRPAPGAQNAPDRFSPAVIFSPLLPSGGGPPGPPPPLAQKGTPPRPPPFINYCGGSAKKHPRMIVGIFSLSPRMARRLWSRSLSRVKKRK